MNLLRASRSRVSRTAGGAASARLLRAAYGAAVAVLGLACLSGCIFGGTGTDTENNIVDNKTKEGVVLSGTGVSARVTDSAGVPLIGVHLKLFDPNFRPDSGQTPVSVVKSLAASLVSDSAGYVNLDLIAAGKFVVEGSAGGVILFYDTLAVAELGKPVLTTFRTRSVKAFQGKARLVSGMRIDSGWVFIRGTDKAVKVDTAGYYDLGLLPADVGRMAVGMRFASKPVSVRQAMPASTDTAKHEYVCKDAPADSAAKLARPGAVNAAQFDTASKLDTGTVSPALKACDSLAKGSVITVSSQPAGATGMKADSVPAALLVLSGEQKVPSVQGTRTVDAVVVPLALCVPNAGSENTTYELLLQSTTLSSDILVKDVAAKCLEK